MKIKLLSDLHAEFWKTPTERLNSLISNNIEGPDVLILAGDIAVGYENVLHVISHFVQSYKHTAIIFVPGNHEYYKQDFKELNKKWKSLECIPGVYVLNPGTVTIGGVQFIGATLWPSFNNNPLVEVMAQKRINDFKVIKGFSTAKSTERHNLEVGFIKNTPRTGLYTVIITHFSPSLQLRLQTREPSPLDYYFHNDLDNYIRSLTKTTWFYGHTHDNLEAVIGDTPIISNAYGYYPPAEPTFHKDFMYELQTYWYTTT